jgi:hypothetical protein
MGDTSYQNGDRALTPQGCKAAAICSCTYQKVRSYALQEEKKI